MSQFGKKKKKNILKNKIQPITHNEVLLLTWGWVEVGGQLRLAIVASLFGYFAIEIVEQPLPLASGLVVKFLVVLQLLFLPYLLSEFSL